MKRAAAEGVYGQGRPVLGVDHGPPPWGKEGEGEADRPSAPECKRLDRTAFPSESQGASKSEQHPKEQDASAEGEGVQSWQPPKEATAVPASLFLTRSLGDEEDDDTYQDNGKDQSSPGDRVGDGEVPQPGRRSSEKGDCYDEEEQEERYEEAEDDYDEDFIKTFLDHAVDAPCQRLAVAPCVADLMDRQMDLFMVRITDPVCRTCLVCSNVLNLLLFIPEKMNSDVGSLSNFCPCSESPAMTTETSTHLIRTLPRTTNNLLRNSYQERTYSHRSASTAALRL
jgi:hypothetical protein